MFFVWAAAMMLSIRSVEVARMFARRVKKDAERRAARDNDTSDQQLPWPTVAVILPIKGVDEDTEANVRALLAQQYPPQSSCRLIFAVESPHDPVVALLQQLTRDHPTTPVETIIAGQATTRGQKIHNQLAAIARTTPADEVLVFLDADARPAEGWLRDLVRPLVGKDAADIGATTG